MAVLGLLGAFCYWAGFNNPVSPAAGIYFLLSYGFRSKVAGDRWKGMQLVKKEQYAEVIPFFEASYRFYTSKPWLDKYRYITLLSSSRMDYRVMALCNIAFCYSQMGEGGKARAYYQQVLATYPENGLAQTALRMMNSVEKPVE